MLYIYVYNFFLIFGSHIECEKPIIIKIHARVDLRRFYYLFVHILVFFFIINNIHTALRGENIGS